jgi:hypothetical protein
MLLLVGKVPNSGCFLGLMDTVNIVLLDSIFLTDILTESAIDNSKLDLLFYLVCSLLYHHLCLKSKTQQRMLAKSAKTYGRRIEFYAIFANI